MSRKSQKDTTPTLSRADGGEYTSPAKGPGSEDIHFGKSEGAHPVAECWWYCLNYANANAGVPPLRTHAVRAVQLKDDPVNHNTAKRQVALALQWLAGDLDPRALPKGVDPYNRPGFWLTPEECVGHDGALVPVPEEWLQDPEEDAP